MKRRIFLLPALSIILLGLIFSFVGCEKESSLSNETEKVVKYRGPKFPWRVVFTWRGILNPGIENPCNSGHCGSCIGLCIYHVGTLVTNEEDITPEMREEGYGIGYFYMESDSILVMEPDRSCDNGDGKLRVIENFSFGSDFAEMFGFDEIIVVADTLPIDYSHLEFGEVRFKVWAE